MRTYSIDQIHRLYRYGYRYDMERHGFQFPDGNKKEKSWEDIRREYYTEEECRLQEEALKKGK